MSITLGKVIELVDEIKPNDFSVQAKTAWINECEGMVQTEIWLVAVEEVISYSYEENKDTQLLVEAPHSKIYEAYLTARIDYANGEYKKYQNTMQMFNQWYREYMRWYAMRYRPADQNVEPWKGYYYTAYGIAVKHGFKGTEEEWLESIGSAELIESKMSDLIVVGSEEPEAGPVLWFNTAPVGAAGAAMLKLTRETQGADLLAQVDGTTYGVANADLEQSGGDTYNFTVL